MTNRYPVFKFIPGVLIDDKDNIGGTEKCAQIENYNEDADDNTSVEESVVNDYDDDDENIYNNKNIDD